jgi:hypothetical protein
MNDTPKKLYRLTVDKVMTDADARSMAARKGKEIRCLMEQPCLCGAVLQDIAIFDPPLEPRSHRRTRQQRGR